ncbi:unnamed protein product [Miscanthus lutarioriparius]|uniref:Uncharacterized protein n=1 Tax=Miscanthus lutarioriparius TaxID=422564 RepID=A0A811MEQ5_9POAL|nr:unnamed protein product [Miscanthus lutarioriparius]
MGSSEDDFTPLSELDVGMNKCRVRGETMQARVLRDDIDQFEEQLIEGKVYALSDFTVDDTRESYMTCSNEFTIYFGSGRKLGVTLYGDIACGFAEDMLEKGQKASVVAVFAGMHVESSHSVCSTTCSKYYLDLEIPESKHSARKPCSRKSQAQKLAESWRTIEQLKRLNPKDYDKAGGVRGLPLLGVLVVPVRKDENGRRKRELAFPNRLRRFPRRWYCLAAGGEHDEVDDAASVDSRVPQRMNRRCSLCSGNVEVIVKSNDKKCKNSRRYNLVQKFGTRFGMYK